MRQEQIKKPNKLKINTLSSAVSREALVSLCDFRNSLNDAVMFFCIFNRLRGKAQAPASGDLFGKELSGEEEGGCVQCVVRGSLLIPTASLCV